MENNVGKTSLFLIAISLFVMGGKIYIGGFHSSKYGLYVNFGEYNQYFGIFFILSALIIFLKVYRS